jgi:predicted nucleic acid-binding protein
VNYLLDTCVLSELTKPAPDRGVAQWLIATAESSKHASVLCLGEIHFGILCSSDGQEKNRLKHWYETVLRPSFSDRVIGFGEPEAMRWAELRSAYRNALVLDAQIAATAFVHGLTVVTRNVKHFAFDGLAVFNPWKGES